MGDGDSFSVGSSKYSGSDKNVDDKNEDAENNNRLSLLSFLNQTRAVGYCFLALALILWLMGFLKRTSYSGVSWLFGWQKKNGLQKKNDPNRPLSLINVGATCYLNSAFQGISACDLFVEEIRNLDTTNKHYNLKKLPLFQKLIDVLNGCSKDQMEISNCPIFRNWNKPGQQDSYELLAYALNEVYNELRASKEAKGDIKPRDLCQWLEVELPMRLILRYEIECGCGTSSYSPLQSDLALHVSIPHVRGEYKLEELIDLYFSKDDVESYECDKPGCTGENTSRLARLRKPLPRTICIHLQRSFWNGFSMTKINNDVSFKDVLCIKQKYCYEKPPGEDNTNYAIPIKHKLIEKKSDGDQSEDGNLNIERPVVIDMTGGKNISLDLDEKKPSEKSSETDEKNEEDEIYQLVSVIEHNGTVRGGHYWCYKKVSGEWYKTDDSVVSKVRVETVLNCQAYILFYEQSCPRNDNGSID